MDLTGYLELFGPTFWRDERTLTVHAFVTAVETVDERMELQVEVMCALSFEHRYQEYHQDPVNLFGNVNTSPAILKLSATQARKLFQSDDDETLEGRWKTLSISREASENGLGIFLLDSFADGDGTYFWIHEVTSTPDHVVQATAGNIGIADIVGVRACVEQLAPPENLNVAVLDIGQGAASFLFADGPVYPWIYFDLGGGVANNAHTFPATGVNWCFTNRPLVILSHWHWDHWAGATYGNAVNVYNAKSATWLAPQQITGPHTNKFKAKVIAAGGTIYLWPIGLAPVRQGAITIGRAIGSNMNNSGLILLVESPNGRFSLLPGDADYRHIPQFVSDRYRHGLRTLVVSHHGGNGSVRGSPPSNIPLPDGHEPNVAVYSVGLNNSYGHPTCSCWIAHKLLGWKVMARTDNRCGPPVRHLNANTGGFTRTKMITACNQAGCPKCSLNLHN